MKTLFALTALLLSAAIAPPALAQGADAETGAVGTNQAGTGGQVPNAFEALPLVLNVGQEIKVKTDTGRTTRGKVVSIHDSRLVIGRPQYPFPFVRPRKEQVFAKDVVQRIDVVDSALNGILLGAAAGVGVTAIVASRATDPLEKSYAWWALGTFLGVGGASAGSFIDQRVNKTIYERGTPTPTVAFVPMVGRRRMGVAASFRF